VVAVAAGALLEPYSTYSGHVGLQSFFPDFDSDLFSLGSQGNRGRSRNPGTDLGRTCQGIKQMLKIQAFMAIFCRQPS